MTEAGTMLRVNGADHVVGAAPSTPLLYVLRNDLRLNGPKFGCGLGECGACAVLVGDRAVRSCAIAISSLKGQAVTTLEGLGTLDAPHAVQAAFVAEDAAQCGYCLNGMIIATAALLRRNADPSEAQIRQALTHHLCRCGAHLEILAAVRRARSALAQSDAAAGAHSAS